MYFTATCNAPRPNIDGRAELDEGFQGFTLFQAGQMVYYHCAEGYLAMSGNAASTCQEDGSWTPMSLQCRGRFMHGIMEENLGSLVCWSLELEVMTKGGAAEGVRIAGL